MILETLCKRYEDLVKKGKIPLKGWSNEKVSFALKLDENGSIIELVDLRKEEVRGKKKILKPIILQVPEKTKRGSNIDGQFLSDTSSYFLGIDKKGKSERSAMCFKAAKELHLKILKDCNSPMAIAIKNYFNNNNMPHDIEKYEVIKENLNEIIEANSLIFMYQDKFSTEEEKIKKAWYDFSQNSDSIVKGQCLVTGKFDNIARLHPFIKTVSGCLASGGNIVAFNKGNEAFESYGHKDSQGYNACVSEYAAFAYTTALNDLLQDKNHVKHFGGKNCPTTLVYWSEDNLPYYQDVFGEFVFGDNKFDVNNQVIENTLKSINDKKTINYNGIELNTEIPFYILGLSPNVSRISIRFFIEGKFGDILKNIINHYRDMEIQGLKENLFIPLWKLGGSLLNSKSKENNLSPALAGEIMQSIFSGCNYPAALLSSVIMRIRADTDYKDNKGMLNYKISYERCSIIKAYLVRNKGRIISMNLNEAENNTAYLLGRLFAIFEVAYKTSVGGEGYSTIKNKYFNAFCANPARVFPALYKLSSIHLAKIRGGLMIYYEKMIKEIMERLTNPLPDALSLEEQGVLILGYHHQIQKIYTKKEELGNE